MGSCTYVLVEEKTARHHLTVAVDNFMCGSTVACAKGLFVIYGNNTATLRRVENPWRVEVQSNKLCPQLRLVNKTVF